MAYGILFNRFEIAFALADSGSFTGWEGVRQAMRDSPSKADNDATDTFDVSGHCDEIDRVCSEAQARSGPPIG
jgi:hypothetical protein